MIRSRTTVRAFRSDPVPRSQLVAILDVARMAPACPQPGQKLVERTRLRRAPGHLGELVLPARVGQRVEPGNEAVEVECRVGGEARFRRRQPRVDVHA